MTLLYNMSSERFLLVKLSILGWVSPALEKNYQFIYSNTRLNSHETVHLNAKQHIYNTCSILVYIRFYLTISVLKVDSLMSRCLLRRVHTLCHLYFFIMSVKYKCVTVYIICTNICNTLLVKYCTLPNKNTKIVFFFCF